MTDKFGTPISVGIHRQGKPHWRIQLRYVWLLACLYSHRYQHLLSFARFSLVGLTGMVADLSVFSLLLPVCGLPLSRALAIWGAMTWNYVLNRHFTFERASRSKSILNQYIGFCTACLLGGIVNWSITLGLCHASNWLAAHAAIAAMFGVLAGSFINYIACSQWVFRPRPIRLE